MSNRWVNRIWVARCTLIGFIYREVSCRLPEEVPKDENTKLRVFWIWGYFFSFQECCFVGAWAICFWFSSIWWNDVPFGKIRSQWKIQDLCNFCGGRLHVTLFDYRTVDDVSGLIHPEWKGTCTNCQGNILDIEVIICVHFSIFGSTSDTWYLSDFVPPTQGLVFVAKFLGDLCSKN